MQLIKHIRRPMTAPSSMPSSKYIQDSDTSASSSDVDEGKTRNRKETANADKQRSNGIKTNRNPKGLDCVEPPKTRLHISTKQEILKGYSWNKFSPGDSKYKSASAFGGKKKVVMVI